MKDVIKLQLLCEAYSKHDCNTGITTYFPSKFVPFEFEVSEQTIKPTFYSLMDKMGWDIFHERTNPQEVDAAIEANTKVKTVYSLPDNIRQLLPSNNYRCVIVSQTTWWEVEYDSSSKTLKRILTKGTVRPIKAAPFSCQLGLRMFKESDAGPTPLPNFLSALRGSNSRSLLLADTRRRYLNFTWIYDNLGSSYYFQAACRNERIVKKSANWIANKRLLISERRIEDCMRLVRLRSKPEFEFTDNSRTNWVMQNAMAKIWEVSQRAVARMNEAFGSDATIDKKGNRTFHVSKWVASLNTFLLASDIAELESYGWTLLRVYADRSDEGLRRQWQEFVDQGYCSGVSIKGEAVPRFTAQDIPRLKSYLADGELFVGAMFFLGTFDADGLWREVKLHISQVERWPSEFRSMPKGLKPSFYWEMPEVEIV